MTSSAAGDAPKTCPAISFAFQKEIINRQNAHIRMTDNFMPNVKRAPIAVKFWSKYDSASVEAKSSLANFDKYFRLLEKSYQEGPKEKHCEPKTENQAYGWHTDAVFPDSHLLYKPRKKVEITIIGEKIQAEKITERPRFTGIPFKLPS
ncbi:uncharacterized protein LOC129755811 [Uranotaenia lowii]|uniref:uncharacterized protein LOC129755811 n=1 Tax=Uranotaenia lowii TaxID=190385 RepID=UPI002478EC27|nr:uncharacterized protein LOC129755811 [Uranotaenia lowii]